MSSEFPKPCINQTIKINKSLNDLIQLWQVKFDLEIIYDNKHFFTSLSKSGYLEERVSEVYEVKGDSLTRHSNRIVFTSNSKIIGIGESVIETIINNKVTPKENNNQSIKSRLGALKNRNQKDREINEQNEYKNNFFHKMFLTEQIHIDVMADNLLTEVNKQSITKFEYQTIDNLSKINYLCFNETPKFVFYKNSNDWKIILFKKNSQTNIIEGVCKELPIEKDAILLKSFIKVENFIKHNIEEKTTDPGLQAIKFMLNSGFTYYPESFKPVQRFNEIFKLEFLRWPLLIDSSIRHLNENKDFQKAFDESMIKIPEVNEQQKRYRELISKFSVENDSDNDSGIDEEMIKNIEKAKKDMIDSYAADIAHFEEQYHYSHESNSNIKQNEDKIGRLKIDLEYPKQLKMLNVLIDLFKQFYENNKSESNENLINKEVDELFKIFISPKLKERMKSYLFENIKNKEDNLRTCFNETFSTTNTTDIEPSENNINQNYRNKNEYKKSVSELIFEMYLIKNETSNEVLKNCKMCELETKCNLIETNYYQDKIKDWSENEIKCWSKTIKGFLLNNNHALLTTIAVMDRANELVTNGHRLRDTQKIAILILMGGSYQLEYSHKKNLPTDDLVFFLNEKNNLSYRLYDSETQIVNNDSESDFIFDKIKEELISNKNKESLSVHRIEHNLGHLSQIKTGEGKTTIVSFIAALKVLQGHKVDIITSNQVLAADGVKEKSKFYKTFEITVSHNNPDKAVGQAARKCYKADIVYGSINNFQFDFLRDRFECLETFGDRRPENNWVILDEVDSLLIDQGGNIAKLSSPLPGMENLRYIYINIWMALDKNEKDVETEIQKRLENKKIELQTKLTSKINILKKKYENKLNKIETDKYLNKLLEEYESDLTLNDKESVIEQLQCEIFIKKLETLKKYNFTLDSTNAKENEIIICFKDSKLTILLNGIEKEISRTKISQDLYEFLVNKIENNNLISLSINSEIELLKVFLDTPEAKNIIESIDVAKDLEEIEQLENENQEEYEIEQNILSETYLEIVTSKIKGQKEIISNLLEKKLIPNHLHKYVNRNLDRWIESALSAKYYYNENQQYKLINQNEEDIIIPVDNLNTGVSMHNTILSNALHQFLQIKHNLCLSFESLTSSYISNLGYIKKYGTKILGLTGTLGSTAEQVLLGEVYNLDFSIIPTYKQKTFQEFPGQIVNNDLFFEQIAILSLGELLRTADNCEKKPRAVLIICDCIKDVYEIETEIMNQAQKADVKANLKIYTDEAESGITGTTLEPYDIVIATNIAGRGTDFKTSEALEENGGLHVIVGFLPCNQRVQDQALGRTSRQGNNGSGQLVVRATEVEKIGANDMQTFDQVLKIRDKLESSRIADIRKRKVKELNFKDNLFEEFSNLYSKLKKEHKFDQDPKWNYVLKDLKERWAFWLEEQDYVGLKIVNLDVSSEFSKFENDEIVLKILKNVENDEINIAQNPFYAICLADEYLELVENKNTKKAKKALLKAIQISGDTESLYSAYIKLFEIAMIEGGQILERYKKAIAEIFFISIEKDENYKINSLNYLKKAKKALEVEKCYLDDLFKEGNIDSVLIGPSSKSKGAVSMGYWYSDSDTNRIGERLKIFGVDTNTCFKGRLTKDLISALPKDLDETRPIFICFNIGGKTNADSGIHWIAIVLLKFKKTFYLLYKDSKGDFENNSHKIKEAFLNHYGTSLNFIQNDRVDQEDDSSCGPMTMNNLEIMAKKVKESGVASLINDFKYMTFTAQNQVQQLRKTQNDNLESDDKIKNENYFLKHLQARHACISVYLGNIDSIIEHINEKSANNLSFDINMKASNYLSKLDPNSPDQQQLKNIISEKDVYELDNIGMGCVYGLKEIHDIPSAVVKSAQAQILSGLSLLLACWIFPPALAAGGPIAGTLISEGITDLITELIKQGDQKFDAKDYIKGKIISYGISIITMGIGAIMSSTKILTKAMNACRNLASKLRACTRFKSICTSIANNLDKIAKYFEQTITKINFAKMCVAEQKSFLVSLQNAGNLKEFQQLKKLQKATDLVLSHGKILQNIAINSVTSSFKGVAISVCTEKIFTAGLGKVMSGLQPKINQWVKEVVTKRVEQNNSFLRELTEEEINEKFQVLFDTNIGEDIADVLKQVSLGVLRHSSNWKMQLVSLGVDSAVSCYEISTFANLICDRFLKNSNTNPKTNTYEHDYSRIIENLSVQISNIIFSKIVGLTGKLATTLPKVIYRGYKAHQEKIEDKKEIEKHAKRIDNSKKADINSREKNRICAQEAVGTILELNSVEVALASSLGASESAVSVKDAKNLLEQSSGVKSVICDGTVAVQMLASKNSDRAVACLESKVKNTPGHLVPLFVENGKLMAYDETKHEKIPIEQYAKDYNFKSEFQVIAPINLNNKSMEIVKFEINRRRITRCTHSLYHPYHPSHSRKVSVSFGAKPEETVNGKNDKFIELLKKIEENPNLSKDEKKRLTEQYLENFGGSYREGCNLFKGRYELYEINHLPPKSVYRGTPFEGIGENEMPAHLMTYTDHRSYETTGTRIHHVDQNGNTYSYSSQLHQYLKNGDFYGALDHEIHTIMSISCQGGINYKQNLLNLIDYCEKQDFSRTSATFLNKAGEKKLITPTEASSLRQKLNSYRL